MKIPRISQSAFLSVFLSFFWLCIAGLPSGASAALENGRDYATLATPQPTASGKRIEVTEFFYYTCPFCNALDPTLEAWVKKQGDQIVFKRIHVDIHGSAPLQRLYYALEAMGQAETYHARIFRAIHVERQEVRTDADVMKLAARLGIDSRKLAEASASFAVQTKASRSAQLLAAYKIEGVPTIAIDGRYLTSPSFIQNRHPDFNLAQLNAGLPPVLDELLAKAQREHGNGR